jgi:hypothetical protein
LTQSGQALDRHLTLRPDSVGMLGLRFWLHVKPGQHQEDLLQNEARPAKYPDDSGLTGELPGRHAEGPGADAS